LRSNEKGRGSGDVVNAESGEVAIGGRCRRPYTGDEVAVEICRPRSTVVGENVGGGGEAAAMNPRV